MWVRARSIDFHERVNWAISWMTLSPQNEMFIYREWSPSPTRFVTLTIVEEMIKLSGKEEFQLNLIDPLANKIQPKSGTTTVEDLNEYFSKFQKHGRGTGGYWETFDTRSTKGVDAIRTRLQNSILVKQPFNNRVNRDGEKVYLPTLWVFRSCRETAKSLKQWRYEEWSGNTVATRDKKEEKVQKWSHYCNAIEGVLKDPRFRPVMRGRIKRKKAPKRFKVRYR